MNLAYKIGSSSGNVIQLNSTGTASTSVNNYVAPGGHHLYETDAGKYGEITAHSLKQSLDTSN